MKLWQITFAVVVGLLIATPLAYGLAYYVAWAAQGKMSFGWTMYALGIVSGWMIGRRFPSGCLLSDDKLT